MRNVHNYIIGQVCNKIHKRLLCNEIDCLWIELELMAKLPSLLKGIEAAKWNVS